MTDEAGLLVRIGGFGIVAGVLYWVLSRFEPLGTIALLLLGLGPGFAGLYLLRESNRQGLLPESRAARIRRLAGLPPPDRPGPEDLEDRDLGVLPLPSIWPFAISLGISILLTGLIFGLWLVILGAAVAAYSAWGWLAAVIREQRYGRILADRLEEPQLQAPGQARRADERQAQPEEQSRQR
jgi:hypothetical protein